MRMMKRWLVSPFNSYANSLLAANMLTCHVNNFIEGSVALMLEICYTNASFLLLGPCYGFSKMCCFIF